MGKRSKDMKESEIKDKVLEIIEKNLGIARDKIKDDADIQNDLGADSLDCVNISLDIEDYWGLNISDEEYELLKTVNNIVAYIRKALDN